MAAAYRFVMAIGLTMVSITSMLIAYYIFQLTEAIREYLAYICARDYQRKGQK